MSECRNCPSPNHDGEWYNFIAAIFDVVKAREIVSDGRQVYELTEATLKGLMLPLEPPRTSADGSFTINMGAGINEDHLSHIPDDKLNEPCIIVPYRIWSKREKNDVTSHIMIDGSHRAVRLYREGKTPQAYLLTEKEAVAVCTNREPRWWKGIRSPKAKAKKKVKQ